MEAQTVWHSDVIAERIFQKKLILNKFRRQNMENKVLYENLVN